MQPLLEYQKWIRREDLRKNPRKLYVFGDNLERVGMGGQAREMRGEPNAFGIPTKRSPSACLTDEDFLRMSVIWAFKFGALREMIVPFDTIVWPPDGIGTGLASLHESAPRCWDLLRLFIADFVAWIEDQEKLLENSDRLQPDS